MQRSVLVSVLLVSLAAPAAAHTWSAGPAAPPALGARQAGLAFDPVRNRVVLFGGTNGALHDDTWFFDGTAWTPGPIAPAGLTPRRAPAMAFDLARQVTVLFGGNDGATRKDTWELGASAWSAGPSAPAPMAPRMESAMAFDLARGRMVLFGGDGSTAGTQLLGDTWEYDGAAWSSGGAVPPALTARSAHAMAYDQIRARIVLVGGFDGTLRSDVWYFGAGGWTPGAPAPAGLTPRSGHAMTYEAKPGRILLFGGFDASGYRSDTWELDGTTWAGGFAAPGGLEPRFFPGIAYDTARGVAVVFGGFDGAAPYFSDTWEYRPNHHFLAGAGLGQPNPNRVRMFENDGAATPVDFSAYGANAWGVNVASGSVDVGSNDEILTGPGPGPVFGPQVRGFLADGSPMAKINFYAYGTLRYGANVAAENMDGDRYLEILSGAGPGSVFGPHVRGFAFDATAITAISKVNFFAYGTLKYGVNVEGGDVDGDGFGEIVTAPGPSASFGPQIRAFNVDGGTATALAKINFQAFGTPQYGANAAAGYVDLDGYAEIVATPGPGPALRSQFKGFDYDGTAIAAAPGFDITRFTTFYGGRVGLGGIGSGVKLDLICSPGRDPAAPATVEAYGYTGTALTAIGAPFDAFPGLRYGANVTGHLGGE